MASSEASLSLEDNDINGRGDNNSVIPVSSPVETVKRRRRWTFMLKEKGGDSDKTKFKALTVSCRCKGAIKGSCLIVSASFVELIGNLIALYYMLSFVLNAVNFYELDNDPEKRAKDYDEQLQRVLFLEKYRVGFVGLMSISVMGLVVAFMMAIGTIYKSWKSIRTVMSLLFAMCFFHVAFIAVYLYDSELTSTAAAIPFRFYELFLLYSYVQYYKKKKLEEFRSGKRKTCGQMGQNGPHSKECLDTASLLSFNPDDLPTGTQIEKRSSEVQVTFDIDQGGNMMNPTMIIGPENKLVVDSQTVNEVEGRPSKKKNLLWRGWPKKNKAMVHYSPRIPDRYIEYK